MRNKSHLEKPITAELIDELGAVMEADFGAQTVLAATLDDTPIAFEVAEDRIVGRQSGGNIDDLTAAQVRTIVELNGSLSPTVLSGGEISLGTNAGTFKVAALTALLRVAHEEIGVLAYVTKAEEDNITIDDSNKTYVVALNYSGGNPTISISEDLPNLTQNIPIGKVMRNGSNEVHYIAGGYMLYNGLARLHTRAKSLRALELVSGSAISYSGVNNFAMTAGVVYGGINKFTSAQYNSASTIFVPVYGDGGSGFTEGSARNTIDFAHYDGGSGALENVGVGRYGVHWVYRHIDDGHVYVVYGLGSYKLAEAAVALVPLVPDHLSDFGLLIGKIIAPQAGGSFALVQMVTDTVFVGTSVATHNNLGGLNDEDYKHLTATEKTLFDTIEEGATKYPDTGEQAFLDADHSKLDGIDTGAKDDQTGAEIKALYEAEANAFTDTKNTKLSGIEEAANVTDAVNVASSIHGVAGKTTPVNADEIGLIDSIAANVLKKLTWANIKATLKTYFDTLYDAIGAAAAVISDTAYNESSWNAVTTIAPSKNTVRDQRELDAVSMHRKNIIINGSFDVWQRGTSFSITTEYALDRWWLSHNATTVEVKQETATTSPINGGKICKMTLITKGGGFSNFIIIQPIETINCRPYAGKTVTLSVLMRRNSTFNAGKSRINIYSAEGIDEAEVITNRQDDYLDIDYSELETSAFTKFSLTVTIASDKTQLGVVIRLSDSDIPDGSYIEIANMQLEEGSVATEFERRSIGEELALCQRYFCLVDDTMGYGYLYCDGSQANALMISGIFPVQMRTNPTAAIETTPSYSNCSNLVFNTNESGFVGRVTATGAIYRAYGGEYSFDAEL